MDYKQKFELRQQTYGMRTGQNAREKAKRLYEEDMALSRLPQKKKSTIPRTVFSWTFQIVLVVMFAYVLVYFFGQSRTNVGQSMDTTLTGGDVVLINRVAYQMNGPERGDIISFKPNGGDSAHSSIKRVVALPGETVQIVDGMLQIDGLTVTENADYPLMTNPGMAANPIKLGETDYFVLGDNRNNSEDSRFADVGLVSSDMIEGKVWFIISPGSHRGFLRN